MRIDLLNAVEDSFSIYAAMTIQNRAIVDARDFIKPAARQCMYAQLLDKITYKKPFKKSLKSVSASTDHFYVHGDASCYALLTRLAKQFTMRYPLEDFDGSYGTISSGDSEAAARYTEMRLGELGCLLYDGIDKECIDLWFDNYDNTEKFPSVVPSLGYYNICNGVTGIATGLASSIPQYNLREVNTALIKLLWNPDIDFDEIYCPPDFCTGATILNGDAVKESHKNGTGKAAIIRSSIEYNDDENCLYVTEIPYGIYAGTICEQIKSGIENGKILGIKNVLDLSTKTANIKIELEKGINVSRLLKSLYKETALQNSYTINFVMLDKGAVPKVFSWREALQAHLDHEKIVYTKIHEYEIKKIKARINIIDGILLAIANIDEVIHLIKTSEDKKAAKIALIERFGFNEPQVEAILKITLSKLAHLEIQSYKDEKNTLMKEMARHELILGNEVELFKEIEAGLRKVMDKWGDDRRTRIVNLDYKKDDIDEEPIEKKELLIHFTNLNNIYTQESSTLLTARRGGKGTKIKLANNEIITQTINDTNFSALLAFTNKGLMYSVNTAELPINAKINTSQLFNFDGDEYITTLTTLAKRKSTDYFIFITKNGYIKKTRASEYAIRNGRALKAINLKEDDEVIKVLFVANENVGLLTNSGNFVILNTEDISAIGRVTAGVKAIKLGTGDTVIDADIVSSKDKYLITISRGGLVKKADLEEFPVCNRGIKGKQISGTSKGDSIVKFLTLPKDCDIINISNKATIKINTAELRILSRTAVGVKGINLQDNSFIVDMVKG